MRSPVHQALRDATADAHDRVDAAFADFDLSDRESYARFLSAHAEVVWPLEAALPGERVIGDWDARKRGATLKEDLALLLPGESRGPEPRATPSITLGHGFGRGTEEWDEAEIAGTLYVLEGSRLGGKFLARRLPPGFPRAYLDADHRAGNWQQLLSVIEEVARDSVALQTALASAHATFAAFERSAAKWRRAEVGARQ